MHRIYGAAIERFEMKTIASAGLPALLSTAAVELLLYSWIAYYTVMPVASLFLVPLGLPPSLLVIAALASAYGLHRLAYYIAHREIA